MAGEHRDTRTRTRTRKLLGALWAKGYTVRAWATAHGYTHGEVKNVIFRHWGRGTSPRGKKTLEILSRLQQEVEGHGTN